MEGIFRKLRVNELKDLVYEIESKAVLKELRYMTTSTARLAESVRSLKAQLKT